MCLKHKEANGHRGIGLFEQRMIAAEKLFQRNGVSERFTHFLSVQGNHVVVHPVANGRFPMGCLSLSHFSFMVRKSQIHSSTMNIKCITPVSYTHLRAHETRHEL